MAEIIKRFEFKNINSFLTDGILRSQFETNTGSGINALNKRAEFEKDFFSAPISLNPIERPIYGYLADEANYDRASYYGEVFIIFDKDKIIDRTTIIFGDSMAGTWENSNALPVMLGKPNHNAFDGDVLDIHSLADIHPYPEIQIHGGVVPNQIKEILFTSFNSNIGRDITDKLDMLGINWRILKSRNPFEKVNSI